MSADFLSRKRSTPCGASPASRTSRSRTKLARGRTPYNLATQERIVRGRMPTLELINERFARYLRIGLFNYMHRNAEVSAGPIKVQKYAEFVRNLVVPTNLNLITAKPLRGTGLVVFDPNLVFLVVDNMFGGDGRFHTRVEAAISPRPSSASSAACSTWCLPNTCAPGHRCSICSPSSSARDELAVRQHRHPPRWWCRPASPSSSAARRRDAHLLPVLDAGADPRPALFLDAERPPHPDRRWIAARPSVADRRGGTLHAPFGTARVSLRDIVDMRSAT